MKMSSTTNQNIYPKPSVYNCNTQIYWNVATHECWEVFTKKKHICPNRVNKTTTTTTTTTNTSAATPTKRPSY